MSSSKTALSFYLLSFAILLQPVFGLKTIEHDCSPKLRFFGKSQFRSSINEITSRLKDECPQKGYGQNTVGGIYNKIHGLALCRGDINAKDCKSCLIEASDEIKNLCPSSITAVIWLDECMLKYSSDDFFGQVNTVRYYSHYNKFNKVRNEPQFPENRDKLLRQLVRQAGTSFKLFGTGEIKVGNSKLYGLAQCTRDLSKASCRRCITKAVSRFRNYDDHDKSTGWFGFGSCYVRFETQPVLKR